MKPTFEVDKKGLAKILARRGIEFVVLELIQNALDEKSTSVAVTLRRLGVGHSLHELVVEDDNPEGFKDLAHAYTLFAESAKGKNPNQRGRFNLGEKLVIAVCKEARITTTKGTVFFDKNGRTHTRGKTQRGSFFQGQLRLKDDEVKRIEKAVREVIVPRGVKLWFNGKRLPKWQPVRTFQATLPTEIADEEGFLRRTKRSTIVKVYTTNRTYGGPARLYEMGIPVVDIDCIWHVDINQKVPLNADRDNVTPAYMREVLTLVLNEMHGYMSEETARAPWVDEALESENVTDEAVDTVLTARYGEKRVIADPSDPEGTKLAVAKGYQVIQAGSFNRTQWDNIRRSGAALPAGQVTPSPKVFSDDPDAPPVELIPEDKWTADMRATVIYAQKLGRLLLGETIDVQMAKDLNGFSACYGRDGRLMFGVKRLGKKWFRKVKDGDLEVVDRLLLHEFGHHYSADHLSEEYHDALCRLGARLKRLALEGELEG